MSVSFFLQISLFIKRTQQLFKYIIVDIFSFQEEYEKLE